MKVLRSRITPSPSTHPLAVAILPSSSCISSSPSRLYFQPRNRFLSAKICPFNNPSVLSRQTENLTFTVAGVFKRTLFSQSLLFQVIERSCEVLVFCVVFTYIIFSFVSVMAGLHSFPYSLAFRYKP